MVVEEDIFNKEVEAVVKKPKRKLTEKQLANLAKGRERMKLKREEAKKNKDVKAEKKQIKESDKVAKIQQKKKKVDFKEKRRTLKEINEEKEQQILQRLQKQDENKKQKKSARMDLFTSLKVKCLNKAQNVNEYNEIKEALDGIDEETLHNDDKLKKYALNVMSPYIKKKTDKIEEEKTEEK
tara:strand:+ start:4253 stop:4798 length:546 start_codon:yes stop_codon:yes gene_type:complete